MSTPNSAKKTNGFAVASLVCGVVAPVYIFLFGIHDATIVNSGGYIVTLLAVIAITAGAVSLTQIKQRLESEKGKGMAIGGLILGGLSVAAVLLEIFVVGPYMRNVVGPQIQQALGGPVQAPVVSPPSVLQAFFPYYLIIVALIAALAGFFLLRQSPMTGLSSPSDPEEGIWLEVLNGVIAGHRFEVTNDMVIGRSSDCAVQLSDLAVSRHHARLRFGSGRWYLQDMNSAGGTYVNGARVGAAVLNNGDRIRIGSNQFEFYG